MAIAFSDVQFTWRAEKNVIRCFCLYAGSHKFYTSSRETTIRRGKKEWQPTLNSQASSVYFSKTFCAMNHSSWSMTSFTSTIKHWNRHKMSALQRFSYISLPLSVKVPRFHFIDISFLIMKSNQHLICYISKFSLFHLYIHYHTVLRIYGYPVGPSTWSSLSWQICRSYHVYFCIQRIFLDFPLFSHISTHRYSHVTHESKNVDKDKKYNLSVSKLKRWKFQVSTVHYDSQSLLLAD